MIKKTLIPISEETQSILRRICKSKGYTYDGLIKQMLIDWKAINGVSK